MPETDAFIDVELLHVFYIMRRCLTFLTGEYSFVDFNNQCMIVRQKCLFLQKKTYVFYYVHLSHC